MHCSSLSVILLIRCHSPYLKLLGEMVGDDDSKGGEERSEEHAHVADIDGDVEVVQNVVQSCGRDHQPCRKETKKTMRLAPGF